MVTYNYPIIVLNVDNSFLVNKVLYHFDMATFSYQVQGSHLMEKKKVANTMSCAKHLNYAIFLSHCITLLGSYSTKYVSIQSRAVAHAAGAAVLVTALFLL